MQKASLCELAVIGRIFAAKVVPQATQNAISYDGAVFCVMTTAPTAAGRATAAATQALAHVLGVAKTRLTLLRGATARDKLFRLD